MDEDDVPFGTPKKSYGSPNKQYGSANDFGSPVKKSINSSGEAADGKKLNTSSSSNSNQRVLSAEEERPHRKGCLSSMRNVRIYFFILILCGVVLFVVVPTVCLISLFPLHNQMNNLLPDKLSWYMNYFILVMEVDEVSDMLNYYTYFADEEMKEKMLKKLKNATDTTISFLNRFCSMMPTCQGADATTLNTSYTNYMATTFPAYDAAVTQRLSILKGYTQQSALRDTLFNAFVTEDRQAQVSRGPYMIANAKLACYSIEDCWKSTDVQTFFTDAEKAVGNLVSSATAAMIDMFSVIEDPSLGETTASEVITKNTERNTKRTDLITSLAAIYTEADTLITPLTDSTTVPSSLEALYFVLPPSWGTSILSALSETVNFATDMNTKFLSDFGITSTATTGVEDALALNISQAEVMSLAESLCSYFGYDIGTGLVMTVSEDQLKVIQSSYNNTAAVYIWTLMEQVKGLFEPTFEALGTLVYSEDKSLEQKSILQLSIPVGVLCSLASFGLYVWALIIVRYHLPDSPLSFRSLLIGMGCIFGFQVGMTIVILCRVGITPLEARAFTYDFLQGLNDNCQGIVSTVSSITRKVVQNGLLISPDEATAESDFNSFSEALVSLFATYSTRTWYSSFFTMAQIFQNLLAAGFYPVRQAFTTASSLGFTATALIDAFGITGVSGAPTTTPEPCNLLTGAAAMSQLNSNYFSLSAVREKLSLGNVVLDQDSLAGEFSSATLQTSCLVSYILKENNRATCYNAVTCSAPATYGMLRSTSETDSIYSIFDPFSASSMGALLTTVQDLRLGLYADLREVLDEVEATANSDSRSVELARRFVVWAGVLTFLLLLAAALVLRAVLFGHSIFSVFA